MCCILCLCLTANGYAGEHKYKSKHKRKHKVAPHTYIAPHTIILDQSHIERGVYEGINNFRISRGLTKLILNDYVSSIARQHSQNIVSGATPMGHIGFQDRVNRISNTSPIAENVAWNSLSKDPVRSAINGWLQSSHHLTNIVGSYNITGIGIASDGHGTYVFTQIFWLK